MVTEYNGNSYFYSQEGELTLFLHLRTKTLGKYIELSPIIGNQGRQSKSSGSVHV